MRYSNIHPAGWFCSLVVGIAVLSAAVAAVGAAEEQWPVVRTTTDKNVYPTGHIADGSVCPTERVSLLQRWLNWPKDDGDNEKKAGDDKKNGENKDESNGDNEKEDEEPLESDRPNFTQASTTVGYHRLQIESGYTFTQAVGGDRLHDSHNLPEMLLRYGVVERLELRVDWGKGMVFDRFLDPASGRLVTRSGSTDVDAGFKYAITKQDKWRPRTAVIVTVSAPVGSPFLSSRQVDPLIDYCYSWEITKKLSLSGSTGSVWTAQTGDRYSQFFQSACVDYELTKKLHVYNEWYGLFRRGSSDDRPQFYYDAGVTYLLTPNFQLDWRAGAGLNDAADGFFTGCGLTIRK
jgi:hypothetical protein